jgi:hypothetical protein
VFTSESDIQEDCSFIHSKAVHIVHSCACCACVYVVETEMLEHIVGPRTLTGDTEDHQG